VYVCVRVRVRVCDVCEFLCYVFVHALMYLCFEGKCIITLIRIVSVTCEGMGLQEQLRKLLCSPLIWPRRGAHTFIHSRAHPHPNPHAPTRIPRNLVRAHTRTRTLAASFHAYHTCLYVCVCVCACVHVRVRVCTRVSQNPG